MMFSWADVAKRARGMVANPALLLDDGQRASLSWIAERIGQHGVVLADEVGTGKTRIACALVHAVVEAGGRAAVVVPHGLMHQWISESKKFNQLAPAPKEMTSLSDFVRRLSEAPSEESNKAWSDVAPAPEKPEWWLISHTFRSPQVRTGKKPAEWRVALCSYVRAALSSSSRKNDGRTRIAKLLANPNEIVQRISEHVAIRVEGQDERQRLRARLDCLPLFKRGGENRQLIAELRGDGEGRRLVEHLLGLWLGEFDLVVIDEAHKSRGDADTQSVAVGAVHTTVLARLVGGLLKQSENGRRLCLTATPMELELSQWGDLLARALDGIGARRDQHAIERRHRATKAIERLHEATTRAAVAPDEAPRLDELCQAARQFTCALAPYVTRRRRDEDALITDFRAAIGNSDALPHPHRRVERLTIGWAETVGTSSAWLGVLFAAECMSQAARGLSLANTDGWPRAVRDAYTKLAAGHVSFDLSEANDAIRVPERGIVDEYTRAKIQRVAYWYRRLNDARRQIATNVDGSANEDLDFNSEHPRIVAAVREIERWTSQREKVLVFGVFLQPLRLLRDVLNVRNALRAADAGRPNAYALHTDVKMVAIAARQLLQLRDEGALKGRLADANGTKMRRLLQDSHRAYERLRRRVRENANKPVKAWRADRSILGGSAVDAELVTALHDHLVSFVLDEFLAGGSGSEQPTLKRIEELAASFLEDHIRPLIGEFNEDDETDENEAQLRQDRLRRALLDEDHDGRQSLHARLLQGATRWETRRYLQAAFNRSGASPWVLIAQSQVGREGLNLHEACRVVVQFHAEWNPAVLEQQIGRVDRKGSLWEQLARKWLDSGATGTPKYIEVRQLVFEGTYDAFQWDRVMGRQRMFDASLFGALLSSEAWARIPESRRQALRDAAPSFAPKRDYIGV